MREATTTSGQPTSQSTAPPRPDATDRVPVHVLLPCFDEELSVMPMVESLSHVFAKDERWDVVAVFIDDGSNDGTWREICRARELDLPITIGGIRLEHNQGKAAAQAVGLREIGPIDGVVILMDADGQHDPSSLPAILTGCLETRVPHVARRTDYRRSRTTSVGTLGLGIVAGLTGVRFDPSLGEYLALPSQTVRMLVRNPQLGIVPILQLVQATATRLETFSSPVLDRADGSGSTRWTRSQLWHKALLLLLANPWSLLPRMAVAIVVTVVALGSYGMTVGIASIVQGTFLGVGSVLVALVLVFAVLAGLQLATLGLVVVLFRTISHSSGSGGTEVEVLDWRTSRE